MALPTSRNRTYAPGSQLFSIDLNDVQDKIIALNGLITAVAQAVWTGITLAAGQHITLSGTGKYKRGALVRRVAGSMAQGVSGTISKSAGYSVLNSAGAVAEFPIDLAEGERLTSVTLRVADGGADQADLRVFRIDISGTIASEVQLGSTASSSGSAGTIASVTVSGLTEIAGSQNYTYVARVTQSGGAASGIVLNGLTYVTDVP